MSEFDVPRLTDEGLLFEYLDQHLNANGTTPQVAGVDAGGTPFLAWLDEEGGDCVGLRVVRLVEEDGGATSAPTPVEAPAQGRVTSLAYPVQIVAAESRRMTEHTDPAGEIVAALAEALCECGALAYDHCRAGCLARHPCSCRLNLWQALAPTVARLIEDAVAERLAGVERVADVLDQRYRDGDSNAGCPAGAGYFDLIADEIRAALHPKETR